MIRLAKTSAAKQRALSTILNQISQTLKNLNANDSENSDPNISINVPGIDLGITLPNLLPSAPTAPTTSQPSMLREALLNYLNEQIAVTTAFDTITGTLSAVETDYIVIVEGNGSIVLIPIDQIESFNAV